MRKMAAVALTIATACAAVPAQAQQTRTDRECKVYQQRGVPGARGSGRLPTSDDRTLQICRTCTVTVRRFFPDKRVCEPWPTLPNG